MYGINPYAHPGAQAPTATGAPGMGQQMMGPMAGQLTGQMMGPMAGQQPMMGKQPMMDQPMMSKMGQMGKPMTMGSVLMGAPGPEETYVENILRMNRGKVATVYTTNENNPEWAARVFRGRVENAARDHVVLSDPETGVRSVILMVNIDFITFDEPLRYEPGIYRM